jgi:hypothetical protein
MVVVGIIMFFVATTFSALGPVRRRNEVLNNMRYVRAALIRGRAKAIEYTEPVRITVTADNRVLVLRDPTRDGDWDDAILVLGESTAQGERSPYRMVERTNQAEIDNPLPHWTKMAEMGNVAEFDTTSIVLLPDGRVLAGDPLAESSGTWYFKDNLTTFYGAVHLTAMGEVKMAYIRKDEADASPGGDFNGWIWTD